MAATNGFAQSIASGSPFLDAAIAAKADVVTTPLRVSTPFVTQSEIEERRGASPEEDALHETIAELHDEAFDEAVFELVGEAASIAAECRRDEYGDHRRSALRAHGVLHDHLRPLAESAERMIDEVREAVRDIDIGNASESEIEAALAPTRPSITPGAPAFEQFLGGLWAKAKKVASGAANLVKKGIRIAGKFLPLDALLGKLKALVRPLLQKVIAFALDKIPPQLRPLAAQLAERFGKQLNEVEEEEAAPRIASVQEELDTRLGELLFSGDEREADEITADSVANAETAADEPLAALDAARERFVRELTELGEGEDPTPAVEHFLPVLVPVLRVGINMVGRDRVVDFLAGIMGKLIAPVVGAQVAPALGKAIVDTGLRTFLQAELPSGDKLRRIGAEAVARSVEDAARRVIKLPSHVLASPALLESHAREAFDRAAAGNLPSALLRAAHREGSDRAVWVALPREGRAYYKRYSQAFEVELTPQLAEAVHTFGGGTLASYVREQLRLTFDRPLRVRVHLYEVLAGGRLTHIAAGETLPGLRSASGWRMLHPLTPEAAAALLQHPRLGRPSASDPLHPRINERVYFLEIDGARRRAIDPPSHVRVTLDEAHERVRVRIHLSETLAQQIATLVRSHARPAAIVHELRGALSAHRAHDRVRVVGPTHAIDGAAQRALATAAVQWSWARIAEMFERSAADFVHAVEATEPGVTLRVVFEHAPGLERLRGKSNAAWPPSTVPPARIDISPGHGP